MSRLKLTLSSLFLAGALVVSLGLSAGRAAPPVGLQNTSDSATDPVAEAIPAITPLAGFVVVSPTEPWLTEVRIPTIIENVTTETLPADLAALGGLAFVLRDAAGNVHGLDSAHPQRGMLPNHSLRFLDPAMAARWTLGFRVPTATAGTLLLELHRGAEVVASWSVDALSRVASAPNASSAADRVVTIEEPFDWAPEVEATAVEVGSRVCGDPTIETVTQVFTVSFRVDNRSVAEVRWPGFVHRDGASMAQWADGTAADMSIETYVGDEETLPRVSTSAVRIPAMTETTRAMVFAVPRDGRFTDTTTLPVGVLLHTGIDKTWLDLSSVESTLPLSPVFCDLGFFGGPIPFGYSPGAKFAVGGEGAPVDVAAFDAAAQMMVTEALAGAALHYDVHGQSFAGVSGEDLVAQAPRLSFVGQDIAADSAGAPGVIYFATRPDDDQYIYVATRSASGRWFCAGVSPHRSAIAADGMDLEAISGLCFPPSQVDEG